MTHDYFTCSARGYIARSGGNPDTAGPLAAWAEAARQDGYRPIAAIIGEDGTIHFEAQRYRGQGWTVTRTHTPEAARASHTGDKDWTFHALTKLLREAGRTEWLLQAHYSDVAEGPCPCGAHRRPYPHTDPRSVPGWATTTPTTERAPF